MLFRVGTLAVWAALWLIAGTALAGQGHEEGVGYYPSGRVQWEYPSHQGEVFETPW